MLSIVQQNDLRAQLCSVSVGLHPTFGSLGTLRPAVGSSARRGAILVFEACEGCCTNWLLTLIAGDKLGIQVRSRGLGCNACRFGVCSNGGLLGSANLCLLLALAMSLFLILLLRLFRRQSCRVECIWPEKENNSKKGDHYVTHTAAAVQLWAASPSWARAYDIGSSMSEYMLCVLTTRNASRVFLSLAKK